MKRFGQTKFREAMDYADAGGQALHVFTKRARVRVTDPKDGEDPFEWKEVRMAHLYDRSVDRLEEAAILVGLEQLEVHRQGKRGQNILLTDNALERAITWCDVPKPPKFSYEAEPTPPSPLPKPPPPAWKP